MAAVFFGSYRRGSGACEDTGYYKANYYTGGLMRYGKGKGCDFINNRCVNSSNDINEFFENEFYR